MVNPAVPENIGSSARAIKTMGFSKLRMINPPEDYMEKAKILAHGSGDVLKNSEIYHHFGDAITGFDFLIATSSKKRRTNEEYVQAGDLHKLLIQKQEHLHHVGIVFGGEESGLSNEEIKKCDMVSYIPMVRSYPSLNLSHAVMIYAYLLSGIYESGTKKKKTKQEASLKVLKEKVGVILEDLELKQKHIIGPRIFEKISLLKNDDISLLHSVCNAYLKK
jgi:tRNA/rRNA methyltransferase